ncbi:MAG: glycosyl hydrolase family 18 protein, partial [Chloroflexi bacterium]|nr:glycosyl hydrolase family 18 protein [Chloroflexota bacterium]
MPAPGWPGPSVAYEESVAHATRAYAFAPGEAVSVPLRQRAGVAAAVGPGARDAAGTVRAAGVATLRREVYGFLPYWELVDPDRRLDHASLSTIAYFSVAAAANGSLVTKDPDGSPTSGWGGWTSQAMTEVIDAAHAAGVRVDFTVTLFAWTSTQRKTQAALLGSASARSRLVSTLVSTVVGRGVDGVNLDIEPLVAGYEEELVSLVRELRGALDAAGPGRRITVDVLGSPENYPHEDLVAPGAADAIFIMGYDYRGSGAGYAGSISPLTGDAYDLTETVARYRARVPASKIILGIPYYGRAWSTVSDALRAKTQTGATYGYSATAEYALAAELAEEDGRRWDDEEQVPWTAYRRTVCDTCTETWRQLYYDDAESLRRKYALADANDLAGVGIWALGYDGTRPELAAVLREVFGGPPTPPTDSIPPRVSLAALPPDAPDEGIVVAWSATDAGGIAAYDVQVATDGGPWVDWLVATTATSDVWLGRTGRGYAFRVRASDPTGNVSGWTTEDARTATTSLAKGGFVRVVASSLPLRASASTTAKALATVKAGAVLLVTAGPKSGGGITWVQVSGPLTKWPIVAPVRTKAWMAVKQGTTVLAAATRRPSATVVAAGFSGVAFDGAGSASLGAAGAARRAFSPGADGARDRLAIAWRARVAMTSVSARIIRPDGSLVGAVPIGSVSAGSRTWTWDGRVAGAVVPDGTYVVQLLGRGGTTTYRAPSARPATAAQAERFAVTVDTVPPVLSSAAITATTLAPDEPGGPASVTVAGTAPDAATWAVVVTRATVTAAAGAPVRTIAGSGQAAGAAWDGTDDAGRRLPRGTYTVTLSMADAAGNAATASWTVDLRTIGPQLTASADPATIAPDGDGVADRATIRWTSDVPVGGAVRVMRGAATVRSWPVAEATSGSVRWDGTDAAGRAVAEGRYAVVVDVASDAGDPATVEIPLVVDRTVRSFVAAPPRIAPADGDALAAATRVGFTLARPAT